MTEVEQKLTGHRKTMTATKVRVFFEERTNKPFTQHDVDKLVSLIWECTKFNATCSDIAAKELAIQFKIRGWE